MPNQFFDLQTEVNYYTNVLIVDELGEIATHLVDALLNHGCQIYYFGREEKETFYYLQGKSNFVYISSFSEIEQINKINYLFFFPAENEKQYWREEDFFWLTTKHSWKSLVCCSLSSSFWEKNREIVKEKKLNSRLVVFTDLFGPRIKSELLGQLFSRGIWEGQTTISENPERKIFPVSVGTLIVEILKLIFATDTKTKTYLLKGKETSLEKFVGLVKNVYPSFAVGFFGGDNPPKSETQGLEELAIEENLEEKIEETTLWFQRNLPAVQEIKAVQETKEKAEVSQAPVFETEVKTSSPEEKKELDFLFQPSEKRKENKKSLKEKNSPGKKILLAVFLFFFLFFLFFVLPILSVGLFGLLGVRDLGAARKAINEGDFALAIKKNDSGKKLLGLSQKVLLTVGPFYALLGGERETEIVNDTLLFAQNLSESFKFSLLASRDLLGWMGDFVSGVGGKEEILGTIKANLAFAYERASLAQSSLAKAEPGFKLFYQTSQLEQIRKYLPESREILLKGQDLLAVLPQILSPSGRKTYLILFENNAELRPTGGFIGSFALVSLENSRLINFEVFDVYQADGQLKGHVEPPPKLKEYLGEASWYLRDSNWDPDFAISAQRAQWFLDKEMQIDVDGTVAITLEAARKVVAALGEVAIPEYQEKINKDNLFQKAEYYAELATFAGSTQKKDFLGSLGQALFEKIKNAKGKEMLGVGGALFASLEQKEILAYSNDPRIELVISNLNWGGRIREYQPVSNRQPIFADFLYLNEANVGINKANYFVQRKIDHQIIVNQEGGVEEKLTLTYDNQSPSESWPAGNYKNYLRLYLPKGARITSVLVTDPKNPGLWLPFDFKYFESTEDHNKSLFGFLFNIPIKSKKTVEIKYELNQKVDLSQKLASYLLLLQKQPGAYPSDYSLSFIYPSGFVPLRVIPSAIVGQEQLLISGKLDRDLLFQVDLAH